ERRGKGAARNTARSASLPSLDHELDALAGEPDAAELDRHTAAVGVHRLDVERRAARRLRKARRGVLVEHARLDHAALAHIVAAIVFGERPAERSRGAEPLGEAGEA